MRKKEGAPYRLYRPPMSGACFALGCALIVSGLLLLFWCIPGWAFAALAGAALLACGCLVIHGCGR